jgi:hypothetical protein
MVALSMGAPPVFVANAPRIASRRIEPAATPTGIVASGSVADSSKGENAPMANEAAEAAAA